ncbi:hypothetical protein OROGR_020807 [Orobanche gracilis]
MALNSNSFFHRPDAKFSPSLWGDHFINHISDSEAIKKNSKTVEALKNDVIRSLVTSSAEGKMIDTMNLIDTLERLGLSHHFQNEIQQKLQQVFNLNTDYGFNSCWGQKIRNNLSTLGYTEWWKELGLISKLPYARDRVVEGFFWTVGVYHQPQYSRARVMFAKTLAIVGLIDDTYDSHGTIEELEVFTEAIDRWDVGEIGRLPEYMRPLYKVLFELHEQFREELAKEGRSYAAEYAIKAMGIQSAPKEDFEWLSKKPKMLMAALQITRFVNDVATYETEKARGQVASGIECYMKEYGVTKEEAMSKFLEMSTNAWKDSNEEYLRPSCCKYRDVMEKLLNLNRIIEVTYANHEDGFTNPEKLYKHLITALFVEPIQV